MGWENLNRRAAEVAKGREVKLRNKTPDSMRPSAALRFTECHVIFGKWYEKLVEALVSRKTQTGGQINLNFKIETQIKGLEKWNEIADLPAIMPKEETIIA